MSQATVRKLVTIRSISLLLVASLLVVGLLHISQTFGAQLPTRSIKLDQATAGTTDTYRLTFTIPSAETLGSIQFQFCSESPLIGQPCTLPTGMDITGAVLNAQTGVTDFTIQSTAGNAIVLTRIPSSVGAGPVSYTFTGIVDPSNAGSYFARILTFATANATGAYTDYGGLAFSVANNIQITATVPPYLYFCAGVSISGVDCSTATGDYINFGDFSAAIASVAQSQLVAGTNGNTGYSISVNGTTLTSGNNIITPMISQDVSRPGVSQFGINLRANVDPQVGQDPQGLGVGQATVGYDTPNKYKFTSADVVALAPAPDEARKYTVSYITNVDKNQAAGTYVSTLTYIATAGF